MELFRLTACEMAQGIAEKRFSALDVTRSCLGRIDSLDDKLNAMLFVDQEGACCSAEAMDRRVAQGEKLRPLEGVPVILKDNICTAHMPTTCASKMLEGWQPPYDATVVELLRDNGAVILGKANLDEFAMGGSTENSAFGVTHNPWTLDYVPGGSSGGSAAAVAAGYAPIALGSDTGGSIRQPAAFCGIYGMKPTYGQVSRYGLVAFASSLDQIGPFTRTADDMALALSALCHFDRRDSTSVERPSPSFDTGLHDMKGRTIGLLKLPEGCDLDGELAETLEKTTEQLKKLGATVKLVELPVSIRYGLACYYILAPAEASSNLARFDGVRYGNAQDADSLLELYVKTRQKSFGPEVKRRILTGTYVLSSGFYDAYYNTAQKVRAVIGQEFARVFADVDALLLPASPTPAFKIGAITDPVAMYMTDLFTIPVNMAGLPGISFNAGLSKEGLPLGLQLVGARWSDSLLLQLAALLGAAHENVIAHGGVSA